MKIGTRNKKPVTYKNNFIYINNLKATLPYVIHPAMKGKIILNKKGKKILKEYLEKIERNDYIRLLNL